MNTLAKTYQLLQRLEASYAEPCRVADVTPSELQVLLELFKQDGQRPTDLARSTGYVPTSFTPMLDRLERRGYVFRKSNPDDRRSCFICLTEKGQALELMIDQMAKEAEKVSRALAHRWFDTNERIAEGLAI